MNFWTLVLPNAMIAFSKPEEVVPHSTCRSMLDNELSPRLSVL
ncbi:hypothetical protein [Hafnia psychrotolerans]|nr:hypothetical protein [Hafnia psychrotolerans]